MKPSKGERVPKNTGSEIVPDSAVSCRRWVPRLGIYLTPYSSRLYRQLDLSGQTMTFATKLLKMSPFGFLRSNPYKSHSTPASFIQASQCVEEERAPHYNPKHFYPMQLHVILANRYQVAAKIGWGTSSTVWLARDLHQ